MSDAPQSSLCIAALDSNLGDRFGLPTDVRRWRCGIKYIDGRCSR